MNQSQREAAERLIAEHPTLFMNDLPDWCDDAFHLLRELLAEPRGEPGFEYKRGYEEALNDCIRNGLIWARSMFANSAEHIKPANKMHACDDPLCAVCGHGITGEPLHAHPPQQRKPLTHQQLLTWWNATTGSMQERVIQYGQFVERSHGITGEPT
ncbi:MAG: hypothetical protein IPN11_14410 [Opitutaceae bacterium]|nr:hypothetical protein [Opitutaceae bacterium]